MKRGTTAWTWIGRLALAVMLAQAMVFAPTPTDPAGRICSAEGKGAPVQAADHCDFCLPVVGLAETEWAVPAPRFVLARAEAEPQVLPRARAWSPVGARGPPSA